jgi:hypothetical protein
MVHRNINLKNLEGEVWKPMVGHKDVYHVSNMGRVKRLNGYSVSNRINKKTGKPYRQTLIKFSEKILVGTLNKKNYVTIHLGYNRDTDTTSKTKKFSILVHREVAKSFIDNPHDLPQINHINGNTYDNNVSNLEWSDNTYNQHHRYEVLKKEKTIINVNKDRVVKVHKYDKFGKLLKTYDSISEAAKENNTTTGNICKVDRGYRMTASGFVWKVDKKSRYQRYRHDGKERGIKRNYQQEIDVNENHEG